MSAAALAAGDNFVAVLGRAIDFDKRQFVCHGLPGHQVAHLPHIYDLAQLLDHMIDADLGILDDGGDTHDVGLFGTAKRERLEMRPPPAQHADYAINRAGPLFHKDNQCMDLHRLAGHIRMPRARGMSSHACYSSAVSSIMVVMAEPGATIG